MHFVVVVVVVVVVVISHCLANLRKSHFGAPTITTRQAKAERQGGGKGGGEGIANWAWPFAHLASYVAASLMPLNWFVPRVQVAGFSQHAHLHTHTLTRSLSLYLGLPLLPVCTNFLCLLHQFTFF